MLTDCTTLDSYLSTYGPMLGRQAAESLAPLHIPARDRPIDTSELLRAPYEPQAHAITAIVKQLKRDRACILNAEMGTGKTLMAMAAQQTLKTHRRYRAIVMVPPQLPGKWQRELEETIPDVQVTQLRGLSDLILRTRDKPAGPEWYIIAESAAKLGAGFRPAVNRRRTRSRRLEQLARCPTCGLYAVKRDGTPIPLNWFQKRRLSHAWSPAPADHDGDPVIAGCGGQLYQYERGIKEWAACRYIHKHLRHYFDTFIVDEIHEEKSGDSARANAMGTLAASCRNFIGLTGTLVGGYAWHVLYMLFRIAPRSLVEEGFTWGGETRFNETYGRIETRVVTKDGEIKENKSSRGRQTRTKSAKPGIMPALFGRHLMDKAVFLSLDDLADNLPALDEYTVGVAMNPDQHAAYMLTENALRTQLAEMLQRGDRRLLGPMLQALLAYPDHPFDWDAVGYHDTTEDTNGQKHKIFVPVVTPPDLDPEVTYPKEQALIDDILKERAEGRQCWVYVQMTNKRDVLERLQRKLAEHDLTAKILRSSVDPRKREPWIAKNAPDADVVLSHPQLVRTGLDLFDKRGSYNFVTIMFYETGYDLFTLRQAARRSWRIGQAFDCRVYYYYYQQTMQARAMKLMGEKLAASEAIEGRFSTEGLIAMLGDDSGSMETALARSLLNRLGDGADAGRAWQKVTSQPAGNRTGTAPIPRRITVAGNLLSAVVKQNRSQLFFDF